jgi:hypothetical protein
MIRGTEAPEPLNVEMGKKLTSFNDETHNG